MPRISCLRVLLVAVSNPNIVFEAVTDLNGFVKYWPGLDNNTDDEGRLWLLVIEAYIFTLFRLSPGQVGCQVTFDVRDLEGTSILRFFENDLVAHDEDQQARFPYHRPSHIDQPNDEVESVLQDGKSTHTHGHLFTNGANARVAQGRKSTHTHNLPGFDNGHVKTTRLRPFLDDANVRAESVVRTGKPTHAYPYFHGRDDPQVDRLA
ncbi:hypothetical protein BKA64DRAFT_645507 [Cadophora sp. MPI-SDFR-AT-0126]|nr:hypothetical protein BKA64DRAFT_645507 [Leotiomycetes sp. MPI-SDFR-AT-0126]